MSQPRLLGRGTGRRGCRPGSGTRPSSARTASRCRRGSTRSSRALVQEAAAPRLHVRTPDWNRRNFLVAISELQLDRKGVASSAVGIQVVWPSRRARLGSASDVAARRLEWMGRVSRTATFVVSESSHPEPTLLGNRPTPYHRSVTASACGGLTVITPVRRRRHKALRGRVAPAVRPQRKRRGSVQVHARYTDGELIGSYELGTVGLAGRRHPDRSREHALADHRDRAARSDRGVPRRTGGRTVGGRADPLRRFGVPGAVTNRRPGPPVDHFRPPASLGNDPLGLGRPNGREFTCPRTRES